MPFYQKQGHWGQTHAQEHENDDSEHHRHDIRWFFFELLNRRLNKYNLIVGIFTKTRCYGVHDQSLVSHRWAEYTVGLLGQVSTVVIGALVTLPIGVILLFAAQSHYLHGAVSQCNYIRARKWCYLGQSGAAPLYNLLINHFEEVNSTRLQFQGYDELVLAVVWNPAICCFDFDAGNWLLQRVQ
jgi:hypothetical protein